MTISTKPKNSLFTLKAALEVAERHGYALGSFAPRYTAMIRPILRAGERTRSPIIVQISQRELERYGITAAGFGEAFFAALAAESPTVPIVLHLDHTFEMPVIAAAIEAGFTSVMIDQSAKPFEENVRVTRQVADYAHARGVSVEAELGKIGTTDFVETDEDEEHFTDPDEAGRFVAETEVDALAVAVGTAHGHYTTRKPRVDLDRLRAIRARTPIHLVLHGGSGVPPEMIQAAVRLPGGGISKVNIATDLEHAMLTALGRTQRMSDAECSALPDREMRLAQDAVERVVVEKIESFLGSANRAAAFETAPKGLDAA
jgi:fructose-bisphosphate aldolase class II